MFWTILISLRQVRRFYRTQEFLQIMQPEQGFVWLQHACFLIIGYPKNPMMNLHVRHQSCINWRHTNHSPRHPATQLPFVGRSGNPSLKTTWFSQNTNIQHPKRHLSNVNPGWDMSPCQKNFANWKIAMWKRGRSSINLWSIFSSSLYHAISINGPYFQFAM